MRIARDKLGMSSAPRPRLSNGMGWEGEKPRRKRRGCGDGRAKHHPFLPQASPDSAKPPLTASITQHRLQAWLRERGSRVLCQGTFPDHTPSPQVRTFHASPLSASFLTTLSSQSIHTLTFLIPNFWNQSIKLKHLLGRCRCLKGKPGS